MEIQKAKIMRFCRVIYTLLQIAFIALIVVGALQALAWIWSILDLNTDIVTIAGVDREVPLLFKSENIRVYLPVAWEAGFDFQPHFNFFGTGFHPAIGLAGVLTTIFSLLGIGFAKSVFKLLRENGSPFREDVVRSLKRLTIALLLIGVVSGVVSFLAAGIVWVLCLIFDYGCALQNESDTLL